MGRMAIQVAAARSIEKIESILGSVADVEVADNMGRTALHWASVGGIDYVVNHIICLSRDLVDQGDIDRWISLL